MDTPKISIKNISLDRDLRRLLKSYAVFKRLEISDKGYIERIQRMYGYDMADMTLMLYAKHRKKISLEESFKVAREKKEIILDRIQKIQLRTQNFGLSKPKEKIEALLFHGFVTLDSLPKRFLKKGYAYISSNSLIDGKLYIYPKRLYDDWNRKNDRKVFCYWQELYEDLILPGIIRVYYSHQYNDIKRYV